MNWVALAFAGLMEVGWAIGLKYTAGFTRLWPSLATVAAMAGSFFLLVYALKSIPVGTAYAIWTGIGATGVAVIGMVVLGESASVSRIACIGLIVAGIIGLKLTA